MRPKYLFLIPLTTLLAGLTNGATFEDFAPIWNTTIKELEASRAGFGKDLNGFSFPPSFGIGSYRPGSGAARVVRQYPNYLSLLPDGDPYQSEVTCNKDTSSFCNYPEKLFVETLDIQKYFNSPTQFAKIPSGRCPFGFLKKPTYDCLNVAAALIETTCCVYQPPLVTLTDFCLNRSGIQFNATFELCDGRTFIVAGAFAWQVDERFKLLSGPYPLNIMTNGLVSWAVDSALVDSSCNIGFFQGSNLKWFNFPNRVENVPQNLTTLLGPIPTTVCGGLSCTPTVVNFAVCPNNGFCTLSVDLLLSNGTVIKQLFLLPPGFNTYAPGSGGVPVNIVGDLQATFKNYVSATYLRSTNQIAFFDGANNVFYYDPAGRFMGGPVSLFDLLGICPPVLPLFVLQPGLYPTGQQPGLYPTGQQPGLYPTGQLPLPPFNGLPPRVPVQGPFGPVGPFPPPPRGPPVYGNGPVAYPPGGVVPLPPGQVQPIPGPLPYGNLGGVAAAYPPGPAPYGPSPYPPARYGPVPYAPNAYGKPVQAYPESYPRYPAAYPVKSSYDSYNDQKYDNSSVYQAGYSTQPVYDGYQDQTYGNSSVYQPGYPVQSSYQAPPPVSYATSPNLPISFDYQPPPRYAPTPAYTAPARIQPSSYQPTSYQPTSYPAPQQPTSYQPTSYQPSSYPAPQDSYSPPVSAPGYNPTAGYSAGYSAVTPNRVPTVQNPDAKLNLGGFSPKLSQLVQSGGFASTSGGFASTASGSSYSSTDSEEEFDPYQRSYHRQLGNGNYLVSGYENGGFFPAYPGSPTAPAPKGKASWFDSELRHAQPDEPELVPLTELNKNTVFKPQFAGPPTPFSEGQFPSSDLRVRG